MNIKYTLSFPAPHAHYVDVSMHIYNIAQAEIELKMAVWTPGSYLIREFQKNIDFVEWSTIPNQTTSQFIRANKTDKHTWKINIENENEIIVRYRTYCYEYSVRTNFVDDSHALINGAATFLYVNGFENTASEIEIIPYEKWNNISTSLEQKENNKWIRTSNNIDELIDSPIEIGNHISYFFDAAYVSHELAIYGESNCNIEKLIADLKKIVEVETSIFGAHPCKNYVFIIHNTENSYGGLEHLYSSVNHITRWSYDAKNYQRPISLLAHEYFHLWNVKRITPHALIPLQYDKENYTDLLWFFEGVTSYYDDYTCYRAGITSRINYLDIVANNINSVLNTAGIDTQTLAEASFDTWLKYYRKNENTNNSQISYYTKGAIVAMIFDFIILNATNGEKSLDHILKKLCNDYLSTNYKGVTEESILDTFNEISGIDFTPYFKKYIHTTAPILIEEYFRLIGIECIEENNNKIHLGLSTTWKDGKLIITELDKNYGAYKSGLNVFDEIIAIDGFRVSKDFNKIYEHKKTEEFIDVIISRQDKIKSYKVALTPNKQRKIKFGLSNDISAKQQLLLNKWLHINEHPKPLN
jgi:predicted metalloprotease with PDZ domain